ncbi:MAG TPA: hypothetical protein PLP27_03280 [Crocinitomicaceae bacterium]|nr:hypothetical protein [Crocinitomicaceae bacterium]
MKTNIKLIVGAFFLLISMNVSAQKQPSTLTKTFKTSANCSMCKDRIEDRLNYVKGVVYSELDTPTKMLTVKWRPKKISETEIKTIVSHIGYDIDEVPANVENQSKLPSCCKPNAVCEH